MKFFIVLSGSSLDRKIDFTQHNVLLPSYYFFSKRTKKFSINAFIPECKEWFLDSGGFSLLSKWQDYPFTVEQYALLIKRKKPNYAATMDYPCEPELTIVEKTKRHSKEWRMSVKERIMRTIESAEIMLNNYDFRRTKIVPVVQGWTIDDYRFCIEEMHRRDLLTDYVAFGSMCRRMRISEARKLITKQREYLRRFVDAKAHYFGIKISFLKDLVIFKNVDSFDTAAWTHNQGTDGRKRMYARKQEELRRNYERYIAKLSEVLRNNSSQTILSSSSEELIRRVRSIIEGY